MVASDGYGLVDVCAQHNSGMYLGTVWDEHRGGKHIPMGNEDRKREKEVQPIMRFTPRTQAERIEEQVLPCSVAF
jgi:hypothetical protein